MTPIGVEQMLDALQAFQCFFEHFIIGPLSESFIGVAILQAELAAGLDDAMLGWVHASSFSLLTRNWKPETITRPTVRRSVRRCSVRRTVRTRSRDGRGRRTGPWSNRCPWPNRWWPRYLRA